MECMELGCILQRTHPNPTNIAMLALVPVLVFRYLCLSAVLVVNFFCLVGFCLVFDRFFVNIISPAAR